MHMVAGQEGAPSHHHHPCWAQPGARGAGPSLGSPVTFQGLLPSWEGCLHQVQACVRTYLIQRVDENQGHV